MRFRRIIFINPGEIYENGSRTISYTPPLVDYFGVIYWPLARMGRALAIETYTLDWTEDITIYDAEKKAQTYGNFRHISPYSNKRTLLKIFFNYMHVKQLLTTIWYHYITGWNIFILYTLINVRIICCTMLLARCWVSRAESILKDDHVDIMIVITQQVAGGRLNWIFALPDCN